MRLMMVIQESCKMKDGKGVYRHHLNNANGITKDLHGEIS